MWFIATTFKSFRLVIQPEDYPLSLERDIFAIESPTKALAKDEINKYLKYAAETISDTLTIDDMPAFARYEGMRSIYEFGPNIPGYGDTFAYSLLSVDTEENLANLLDITKLARVTFLGNQKSLRVRPLHNNKQSKKDLFGNEGDWFTAHQYYRLKSSQTIVPEKILLLEKMIVLTAQNDEDAYVVADNESAEALEVEVEGVPYEATFLEYRKIVDIFGGTEIINNIAYPPVSVTELTYSNFEIASADHLAKFVSGDEVEVYCSSEGTRDG